MLKKVLKFIILLPIIILCFVYYQYRHIEEQIKKNTEFCYIQYDFAEKKFTVCPLKEKVNFLPGTKIENKDITKWKVYGRGFGFLTKNGELISTNPLRGDIISKLFSDENCIDFGLSHSTGMAITKNGILWIWGVKSLSDRNMDAVSMPIIFENQHSWNKVSLGHNHGLAIEKDGTLWGWGDNRLGQIGTGQDVKCYPNPVQISKKNNWAFIAAGQGSSFAITTEGELWGWGWNENGVLGIGTTENKKQPIRIGTRTDWKFIAQPGLHTVGITKDGKIFGWGSNSANQLGSCFDTIVLTPVEISKEKNWLSVDCAYSYTIAISKNGNLYCWGIPYPIAYDIYEDKDIVSFDGEQILKDFKWHDAKAGLYFILGQYMPSCK